MSVPTTGPTTDPGPLERRYRTLLRMLPAGYRAVWEDDMVATFLAGMHTGDAERDEFVDEFGRPGWSEVASVVALATRLRVPGLPTGVPSVDAQPARRRWGAALRIAVLTGLLVRVVSTVAVVGTGLWLHHRIVWLPAPPAELADPAPSGLWQRLWLPEGVAWTATFVALLLGQRPAARAVATLAVLVDAVRVLAATAVAFSGPALNLAVPWLGLLEGGLILVAIGAFGAATPPPRRRPWLIGVAAGTVALWLIQYLSFRIGTASALLGWSSVSSMALIAAAVLQMAVPAWRRGAGAGARTLALALLAALVFVERLASLPFELLAGGASGRASLLAFGLAQAVAVLVAGTVLAREHRAT